MTPDEMRMAMSSFRSAANHESDRLKDPQLVLERMEQFYAALPQNERDAADSVICDWVLSEDENLRFDALAMIREFGVLKASASLETLVQRLSGSVAPSAPYETAKARKILEKLKDRSRGHSE